MESFVVNLFHFVDTGSRLCVQPQRLLYISHLVHCSCFSKLQWITAVIEGKGHKDKPKGHAGAPAGHIWGPIRCDR